MSTTDEPIPEPLPDDGQAAASAESVQGIYAALSPEALDREVDATPGPFVDDALLAAQKVHVVLVAHDGERWLPQSLESLNRVDAVLESVVAVDTGSRDATAELLSRSSPPQSPAMIRKAPSSVSACPSGFWITTSQNPLSPSVRGRSHVILAGLSTVTLAATMSGRVAFASQTWAGWAKFAPARSEICTDSPEWPSWGVIEDMMGFSSPIT